MLQAFVQHVYARGTHEAACCEVLYWRMLDVACGIT